MAEYDFTSEQQDLRRGVRQFLDKHSDEATVRRLMDGEPGYDPATWARLGAELGVLGLAVPEDLGGAGGGLVDQAVVLEECGAALTPGPLLGTVGLAIPALVALAHGDRAHGDRAHGDRAHGDRAHGDRAHDQLARDQRAAADELGPLVEGARTAALAVPERDGRYAPDLVTVTADGDALTGEIAQVVDGGAEVLLVAARGVDGVGVYAVEGGTRRPLSTLDRTRRQAAVTLDGQVGRRLAGDAEHAITHALRVGAALLAAEQVGGAQRLLDVTVAHAGQRLQFGRPIGSFQAVKHRCADMLVRVEHARSTAYHAVWALQDGSPDAELAVSVAQATCSEAYRQVALDAVQLLGGIGFTWEHPAHLYLKRAVTDAALLGSAAAHREHVAALVLDPAVPTRPLSVATG